MQQILKLNKHGVMAPDEGLKLIIPIVSPDKGGDVWDMVESLIQNYTKLHPEEMQTFMEENKKKRHLVRDKFGGSKGGSMRWGMDMPVGLDILIKKHAPGFLENKDNFRKFMKKFPGFTICEVV